MSLSSRISCHPDAGRIGGVCIRRNAWVAPRSGQEIETGTGVLHSYSALDRSGCRAGLHRYQSRRNPGRRFGYEVNAGPTEFRLGMVRRDDHDGGNVRRWRRDVCCVDSRSPSCRAVCSPDSGVQLPEPCSSDQTDNSFRAYAVFIEAMSLPARGGACLSERIPRI